MLRLAQHEHALPQEAHISWRSTTVLAMHAFEWYHDLLVTARLLQFDLNTLIQPKGVFLLDVAWNKLLLLLKRPLLLFLLWLQLSALEQKWTTIMMILSWYPYVSMVSCLTWFILLCFPDCKAWNKMSPSVRLFGIGLAEHFVSKSHCCQETQLWLVAQFCILQSREVGQLVRGFLCVLVLPYNDLKARSHHGYNIGSQLPSQKTCNILVPQNETQQRSRSKAPWLKAPWLGVSHATEAHLFVCRTLRILPGMLSVAGMTLRGLCREWCLRVSDFCLHPPQLFWQNVLAWPMNVHTVWVPNDPTPVASGPNPRFWSSLLFTWKDKVRHTWRTTIGTNNSCQRFRESKCKSRHSSPRQIVAKCSRKSGLNLGCSASDIKSLTRLQDLFLHNLYHALLKMHILLGHLWAQPCNEWQFYLPRFPGMSKSLCCKSPQTSPFVAAAWSTHKNTRQVPRASCTPWVLSHRVMLLAARSISIITYSRGSYALASGYDDLVIWCHLTSLSNLSVCHSFFIRLSLLRSESLSMFPCSCHLQKDSANAAPKPKSATALAWPAYLMRRVDA